MGPAKNDGFLDVDIISQGTNFQLSNSLTNPTVILTTHDVENVGFTAFWNLTNPGDFTVHKQESFHIDLEVVNGDWEAIIDAEPTAENPKPGKNLRVNLEKCDYCDLCAHENICPVDVFKIECKTDVNRKI